MHRSSLFAVFVFLFALAACAPSTTPGATGGTEPTAPAVPTELPPTLSPTEPPATAAPPTELPPTAVAVDATPTFVPTPAAEETPAGPELEAFISDLTTAVANQEWATMTSFMSDSFGLGAWRSEWQTMRPGQAIEQIRTGTVPSPLGVQFTGLSETEIGELLGQPPSTLLGPDAGYAAALHSTGWGNSLSDEAILFITDTGSGYAWSALLYTSGRFADASLPVVPPPTGLLYSVFNEGMFEVLPGGETRTLIDAETAAIPNLRLAPDGRHAAYLTDDRRLWRIDTTTGERQQLAADLNLSNFLMWADANTLFTGVWFTPEEADGPNFGHLTTVYRDEAPQIIDEESLLSNLPALSPDKQTIAFDGIPASANVTLTGRLYTPEGGVEVFDPAAFSPVGEMIDGPVFNPSWSPDGRRLTWLASTGERVELQVYDFDTGRAVQLFDWDPARFGGTIPAPVWSPDGQWLALSVLANGPQGSGLYLIAADGSEVKLVDAQGFNPYWVDDTSLVFGAVGLPRVYDLVTGQQALLDLPAGSWPQGVVRP